MEKHYSDWFESLVRGRFDIARREVLFDELCYTVKTGKTPS